MPSYELPPQPADLQTWVDALTSEAEAIRRDIAAKRQILERIDERLSLAMQLVELERATDPPDGTEANATGRKAPLAQPEPSRHADGSNLEDEVESILADAGSPLHISRIRELLIERGVPIPGRGDDANIIIRLTKDDERFNRTARGTYALKSWALPTMQSTKRGGRKTVKR